jgi:hypothetical protein
MKLATNVHLCTEVKNGGAIRLHGVVFKQAEEQLFNFLPLCAILKSRVELYNVCTARGGLVIPCVSA